MNTTLIIEAARKYLGVTGGAFNSLVRDAANKYSGTNKVALNDALVLALNKWIGPNSNLGLTSAISRVASGYIGGPSFGLNSDVDAALTKYLTLPPPDPYLGADIVLDFAGIKNGGVPFYRVDGIVYSSAAAAGYTGKGVFSSAGYTAAVEGDGLEGRTTITGDFIVTVQFVQPTPALASDYRIIWLLMAANNWALGRAPNGYYADEAGDQVFSATKIASGRSSGIAKSCANGVSVVTGPAYGPPGGGARVLIGWNGSGRPMTSALELFMIHKATLSDAQIQAL